MTNPQATLTRIATGRSKNITGTKKVKANRNFETNVAPVDAQICCPVCTSSDSSEMCIPRASEKASAIAMVRIPPTTTGIECVPEWSPTISPRVVIAPEVNPKVIPVFNDSFIGFDACSIYPSGSTKMRERRSARCREPGPLCRRSSASPVLFAGQAHE